MDRKELNYFIINPIDQWKNSLCEPLRTAVPAIAAHCVDCRPKSCNQRKSQLKRVSVLAINGSTTMENDRGVFLQMNTPTNCTIDSKAFDIQSRKLTGTTENARRLNKNISKFHKHKSEDETKWSGSIVEEETNKQSLRNNDVFDDRPNGTLTWNVEKHYERDHSNSVYKTVLYQWRTELPNCRTAGTRQWQPVALPEIQKQNCFSNCVDSDWVFNYLISPIDIRCRQLFGYSIALPTTLQKYQPK